jgi:hypothetical protein
MDSISPDVAFAVVHDECIYQRPGRVGAPSGATWKADNSIVAAEAAPTGICITWMKMRI